MSRCAFSPTTAAPMLASWFCQNLPSAVLAEMLLTLFFAWNVSQTSKELEAK